MGQPWQQGLPAYLLMFLCAYGYFSEFVISHAWMGITLGLGVAGAFVAWRRQWWFVENLSIFVVGPLFVFLTYYGVGYGMGELLARFGKPQVETVHGTIEKHISSRNRCRNHLLLDGTAQYRISNTFLCVFEDSQLPPEGQAADFLIHGRSMFTGMVVDFITLARGKASSSATPAPPAAVVAPANSALPASAPTQR